MIKDLKDLKQLLLLCRKQGVTEICIAGCDIKFGELPQKTNESEVSENPSDELTEEQLMYYSVEGAK